ncbi:MAG: hypothetical protein GXP39_09555 [Chloroflexi bacterium]|nr:hypothetical protein [Chloroflexota bacterium]
MRYLALLVALVGFIRRGWTYFQERIAPELSCMARSLAALVYGYLATTMVGLLVASGFLIATRLGLSDGIEWRLGPYLIFAVTPGALGTNLQGGPGLILLSALVGFAAAFWVRIRCAIQIRRDAQERERQRAQERETRKAA